jgi:hypothetical protein
MDLEKVKSTLKNILVLLEREDAALPIIEKDLVLNQLRYVYEQILFEFPNQSLPKQQPDVSKHQIQQPEIPVEKVIHAVVEPFKPVAIQVPDNLETQPVQLPKVDASKHQYLFSFPKSVDLSEKLGLQIASDLNKSLTLNDKLWYTNELFNKDGALFQSTIQKLNLTSLLDEAKEILIDLADKNDWGNHEKKETAILFSKIVLSKFLGKL